MILLDCVVRVGKTYPQTLLEECKYVIKLNKMKNLVNDDLSLNSSNDKSDDESGNESDDETGCLDNPYFLTGCSTIKFFNSLLS